MKQKSLRKQAQEIGISPAFLSRALAGRQKVSNRVLRRPTNQHNVLAVNSQELPDSTESVAGSSGAPNGIRINVRIPLLA
jgi:hypothetical protein